MNVAVSHISWSTQPYGQVKPYLHFNPVGEQKWDTVMGVSAYFLKHHQVGIGTLIEIYLPKENDLPQVAQLVKVLEASGRRKLPQVCPACSSALIWKGDNLFCSSLECPVKERTLIARFLSYIPHPVTDTGVSSWLDTFPTRGGLSRVEIKDIRDFLQQFLQAGPKASTSRLKVLQSLFKENGVGLFQLEKGIEIKLKEGVNFEQWWYIQNLPGIGKDEAKLLAGVNPLASTLQKIALTGLDETKQETLAVYQDRWIALAQFWQSKYRLRGV